MEYSLEYELINPDQLRSLCRLCLSKPNDMRKIPLSDLYKTKIPKLFEITTSMKVY